MNVLFYNLPTLKGKCKNSTTLFVTTCNYVLFVIIYQLWQFWSFCDYVVTTFKIDY
jgi:hypothetical protein